MPSLSDKTREARRRAILESAVELLSREPGAPLEAVAQAAGIGRATLYRYFADRDALMTALALEALDRVDHSCVGLEDAANCEEALRLMFEAVVPLGAQFHFLATDASSAENAAVRRRYRKQQRQTEELVAWGQSTSEIDPKLPTRWVARVIDGLIWTGWLALADGSVARNDAGRLSFEALWRGVKAPEESS